MDFRIENREDEIALRWGEVTAVIDASRIAFGHLGCLTLAKFKGKISAHTAEGWDAAAREHGLDWRTPQKGADAVAKALIETMKAAGAGGLVLWDTMREGNLGWRPGGSFLEVAEKIRVAIPEADIAHAREDGFCPPVELLHRHLETSMTFAEYAAEYAAYLEGHELPRLAAACVILDLARRRLPIFYCVDPYMPDFGRERDRRIRVPYRERHYCDDPALRTRGCHRVVLAEEIVRVFQGLEVPVTVYEIDPTFGTFHLREY